jgi:hypothetical protein
MAKRRKAAKARKAKAKPAKKTVRRKTAKRAAAKKPARKAAKRRPRKAKSASLGARLEHAMTAVLDTLTDAERLQHRLASKGVQELD